MNPETIIELLAAHDLAASWEHPGYVHLDLPERVYYLACGTANGRWECQLNRHDGVSLDDDEWMHLSNHDELPLDATAGQIAAMVYRSVLCYAQAPHDMPEAAAIIAELEGAK